jgi:DNA-binding transcriptional ArsR family regulator
MNRAVTVRVSRKLFDYQAKLTAYIHIIKYVVMKTRYSRALPKEWKPMSEVFTALGDEHRQRMLLLFEKGERLNVGQIVEVSPLSRSAVSHHLAVLKRAGVLRSEKVGKEVYFWIDAGYVGKTLRNVLDYMSENL